MGDQPVLTAILVEKAKIVPHGPSYAVGQVEHTAASAPADGAERPRKNSAPLSTFGLLLAVTAIHGMAGSRTSLPVTGNTANPPCRAFGKALIGVYRQTDPSRLTSCVGVP